jgi:hypothetical protein
LVVALMPPSGAAASNWGIGLGPSSGEVQAEGAPAAPTGLTSACTSALANTVMVSWDDVAQATSYSVYQSTTSPSSGFVEDVTGVVGTSWTSPALASGTYWFEVADDVGTNWSSSSSSATLPVTIALESCPP